MVSALHSFVLFTFLAVQCLAADKPTMTPAGPLIEIQAGYPLEITCKSTEEMRFFKPLPQDMGGIKPSDAHETGSAIGMHSWTLTLHKPSTNIADSGFYGCANNDVIVDESKHDQSDVTWLNVIIANM